MEDEYPKSQRFVRPLGFNGNTVDAKIEKPQDGKNFIDYLVVTEPGQRPSRYTPRKVTLNARGDRRGDSAPRKSLGEV